VDKRLRQLRGFQMTHSISPVALMAKRGVELPRQTRLCGCVAQRRKAHKPRATSHYKRSGNRDLFLACYWSCIGRIPNHNGYETKEFETIVARP